jgi:hypothetical protein
LSKFSVVARRKEMNSPSICPNITSRAVGTKNGQIVYEKMPHEIYGKGINGVVWNVLLPVML